MDRKIYYLKKLIVSNLQTKYTIKGLAELIGLSTSHLQERFKAALGTTPMEYLLNLRLEKAKELLETNIESNIKRICYEVGFNDQQNFSRYFKRKYGLTPTQYVNQHWEQIENEETKNTKSED